MENEVDLFKFYRPFSKIWLERFRVSSSSTQFIESWRHDAQAAQNIDEICRNLLFIISLERIGYQKRWALAKLTS